MKLHKAGIPLREIAADTELGMRTVRTIIDNGSGDSRAVRAHRVLARRELKRQAMISWRARKRHATRCLARLPPSGGPT